MVVVPRVLGLGSTECNGQRTPGRCPDRCGSRRHLLGRDGPVRLGPRRPGDQTAFAERIRRETAIWRELIQQRKITAN